MSKSISDHCLGIIIIKSTVPSAGKHIKCIWASSLNNIQISNILGGEILTCVHTICVMFRLSLNKASGRKLCTLSPFINVQLQLQDVCMNLFTVALSHSDVSQTDAPLTETSCFFCA